MIAVPKCRQARRWGGWWGKAKGLEQPLSDLLSPTEASCILLMDILREEMVNKFKSSESEIQLTNLPSFLSWF